MCTIDAAMADQEDEGRGVSGQRAQEGRERGRGGEEGRNRARRSENEKE
jgi:hypothetical protein